MAANCLQMVHRHLDRLPEIRVPDGYALRTYRTGDEEAWAAILESGFGPWTAEAVRKRILARQAFRPAGTFFATFDGVPVGCASAWQEYPEEWMNALVAMVCVLPEHRGRQVGCLVTVAVLRYFRARGVREVWLHTDDWRIPAIRTYLRLGFEPVPIGRSHQKRWRAVFRKLHPASRKEATDSSSVSTILWEGAGPGALDGARPRR